MTCLFLLSGCAALTFTFHFRRLFMRSDLTDITLVVDRSGSMASVRDDAEGGINSFA